MDQKTKNTVKRLVACLLSLFTLMSCFGMDLSASDSERTVTAPLKDGVYRIRNISDGQYLSAYPASKSTKGKAYLKKFDQSDNGQCFLVRSDNGLYRFTPMSDDMKYSLSWEKGTAAGSLICYRTTDDNAFYLDFELSEMVDGSFTVSPAMGDNAYAVLGIGDIIEYKNVYASFVDYDPASESQKWQFEPVTTTRITAAYAQTTVKLYTSGRFFARKYPFNVITDDIVWTSSDDSVIMIGDNGVWCALSVGRAEITAAVDQVSVTFTVNVSPDQAFTWYSQNNIFTSDWDGSILQNVYFSAGGIKRTFAIDAKALRYYSNWIDSGCALCSVAQVLHNLGATYAGGYDLRSGQDGDLPADPYTVALANTSNKGAANEKDVMYGNPIYMSWQNALSKFFVNGEAVTLRKIGNPSRATIKKLLDTHPQGIVAQLTSGSKTHYVVIAKCINPESTVSTLFRFTVYDPAAYFPENGDGVPFEESTSYTYERYRYTSIRMLIVIDVESNIYN